ncbi:MarR family winged helix-turn-helix transcriptional regulator [Kitasatospora aureofaciens]|uniref:MarR family winged helix-turn-helix transcriptional regulator n=1 Tax=Kitasatospora aureofaciens TaxID=1894 RepID=UPI0037CC6E52
MQDKGLVSRVRDDGDRRTVKIRLTDLGLKTVDRVLPLNLANEDRLLQAFGGSDRDQLAGLLTGLLESYGDTPPSPRVGR